MEVTPVHRIEAELGALQELTDPAGEWRMYAADDAVLYVGKAGELKKRVASYFSATPKSARIMSMLSQVARMEVTVTRTETEALLLENELIKSLKPRYNVLLRDDKSYPYVLMTNETWPRIAMHRGPRAVPGRYFGPYASVGAVRDTLNLMHKLFKLRSCEDSVFRNRSRPCLQYQIGRCSGPCVGLVSKEDYARSVRRVELFLEGRSSELGAELELNMAEASARLDFEEAARVRDLIGAIVDAVPGVHADEQDLAALNRHPRMLNDRIIRTRHHLLLLRLRFSAPNLPQPPPGASCVANYVINYAMRARPPRLRARRASSLSRRGNRRA